jgi:hypothetical protein
VAGEEGGVDEIEHPNPSAFAEESGDDRAPDAVRAAGDERHAALESSSHPAILFR